RTHWRHVGQGLFRLGWPFTRGAVPRTRPQTAGIEARIACDRTNGGNMISYDLKGKTSIVTGGASGIGFATARMLAKFGATVAVTFLAGDPRGPEPGDKINAEGGKAMIAPGSVGEAGICERMVLQAIDDLGRLDLLVNNAGTPGTRRRIAPPELEMITEDLWAQLLQTNLLGVFRGSKTAAPALKASHGAIVSTASIAGLGRAGSSLAY